MSSLKEDLVAIVGEKVTTSEFERWFYTSDFVSIPRWVKSFFKTMPLAVVKPCSVEEVSGLLRYCNDRSIPVIARGGGTSGLFGAVPKKGGVVLDLRDLSAVRGIDVGSKQVMVEAGLTWWELDRRLREEGLALKSYPSSARSATIGGWVMGSGLGIGSLIYGPLREQLLSVEVVFADGTMRTLTRDGGLERLCETEGILGVVTGVSLTIRTEPEGTFPELVHFGDVKELFDFVRMLVNAEVRPYAVEIFDDRYLSLAGQSGCKGTDRAGRGGSVLATWEDGGGKSETGRKAIEALAKRYHGEMRDGALHEWNNRFNMLRIGRAVPTVIPVGAHVPVDKLERFYRGIQGLRKRTIGFMGHVVSPEDCMTMSMLVTDQDEPVEFALALHVPSRIFSIARSVGGRPAGGIGVWNAPYRKEVLSLDRIEDIERQKKEVDPRGILNPGMWSGVPFMFKPGINDLGMKVFSILDRICAGRTSGPGAQNEFKECVQCGYCMNYCPTRGQWISSTPRGRILMTKEVFRDGSLDPAKITPEYVRSVFDCSLCGRCSVDCSVSIGSPAMWVELRKQLVENGIELSCLKGVATVVGETHNTAGKPNSDRANWAKRVNLRSGGVEKNGRIIYFTGCVTSFFPMVQDIARSFVRIADYAGFDVTLLGGEEWCCGYPLISAGHIDAAAGSMRHNIEAVAATGLKTLVVTCPGCYRMWNEEYFHITGEKPPIEVLHSTEFISRLIKDGRVSFKNMDMSVTYHDPCDLGRLSGVFDEPRSILEKIPGFRFREFRDNREHSNCCGSGGDLLVSNQELSLGIARRRLDEAIETGAETVVTACPSCVRSLMMAKNAGKAPVGVKDITQVVWEAMVKTERSEVGRG